MAEKAQDFSDRSLMNYAVGKSYQSVVSTPDFSEDSFGRVSQYGPPIGAFQLASGDMVHRHIKRYGASASSTDFGIFGSSEKVRYAYRLGYFLVGADGTVKDWAVGTVPGETTRCAERFYGLVEKCEGDARPEQSLIVYDQTVRTSSGQPLSAWGPAAPAPMAGDAG